MSGLSAYYTRTHFYADKPTVMRHDFVRRVYAGREPPFFDGTREHA